MADDTRPKGRTKRRRPAAALYRPGMMKNKAEEASSTQEPEPLLADAEINVVQEEPVSSEEDVQARQDEIAVIESIYPEMFYQDSTTRIILQFQENIRLTVDLPYNYPSSAPPTFELSGPSLQPRERTDLLNSLNDVYLENMGMPILFTWITAVNDFIQNLNHSTEDESSLPSDSPDISTLTIEDIYESKLDIKHGDVFSDRKSHFQAHLSEVRSKEEVNAVLKELLRNNKIARATHNIYAYRIRETRNGRDFMLHDCEDDGETGASSKMLDLLDKMGAENVVVVVTRWYGGIHLGPDRFRIINNVCREIVTQHGYDRRG